VIAVDAYVVVATKGRPDAVARLLDALARQTHRPRRIVVVGAAPADIAGLASHPLAVAGLAALVVAERPGLTIQRNTGISALGLSDDDDRAFVTFFDDDFRPAADWLERAAEVFTRADGIAGLTGCVLADGIHGAALSEAEADAYLDGQLAPHWHWASGPNANDELALYGCNMSFSALVVRSCRFDDRLPLYGWQEDRDYTGQARAFGRTIYFPGCRGVHLAIKTGRTSGVRFGYSQISNPIYLMRKGTMQSPIGRRFLARALAANLIRSFLPNPSVDYRGRLIGNLRAFFDLLRDRCHPERITTL
jgi:GT2 family glycosyltransferase